MKKILLTAFLALTFACGSDPIAVDIDDSDSPDFTGTYIYTAQDLNNIRNNLSGNFKLANDIDLSAYSNWEPIGNAPTSGYPFTGRLDGAGHKITNLFISSTSPYRGLFGYTKNTAIKNLTVDNAVISTTGNYATGIITGYMDGGLIDNITVSGTVSSVSGDSVGGITGYMNNSASIQNSSSAASVSASDSVGGIAGYATYASLKDSKSSGTITGTNNVGGAIGLIDRNTAVSSVAVSGDVSGNTSTGGIVGNNVVGSISNSFSTGQITATGNDVGGIAGRTDGTVQQSYSESDVTGVNNVGGITGYMGKGFIINCHSKGQITAQTDYAGGIAGVVGAEATVRYTYSTAQVQAGRFAGGIAGNITYTLTIYQSYVTNNAAANPSVKGTTDVSRISGGAPSSTSANVNNNLALDSMGTNGGAAFNTNALLYGTDVTQANLSVESTYTGWSFGGNAARPWKMPAGGGLPILYWQQ